MSDELTTDQVREIAQSTMDGWLDGYQHPMNLDGSIGDQVQFRQMGDGAWRVDPADGARAQGTLGTFRITVTVERVDLPVGLCGNKADHEPHDVTAGSLAPFHCSADQSARLPYAAERRRSDG